MQSEPCIVAKMERSRAHPANSSIFIAFFDSKMVRNRAAVSNSSIFTYFQELKMERNGTPCLNSFHFRFLLRHQNGTKQDPAPHFVPFLPLKTHSLAPRRSVDAGVIRSAIRAASGPDVLKRFGNGSKMALKRLTNGSTKDRIPIHRDPQNQICK